MSVKVILTTSDGLETDTEIYEVLKEIFMLTDLLLVLFLNSYFLFGSVL